MIFILVGGAGLFDGRSRIRYRTTLPLFAAWSTNITNITIFGSAMARRFNEKDRLSILYSNYI